MSLGPEHVEAVERAADKIHSAAVMLTQAPPSGHAPSNAGNANITVNMPGGWAAIACAALAAVCFYIAADARSDAAELRAEARDLGRKVERREDYLNMLWQKYPELRPDKLQQEKR